MEFRALATYLEQRHDDILRRWRERARTDPTQALARLNLSDRELDDHLPSLLDDVVRCLRGDEAEGVDVDGANHGQQRRRLGYHVTECLAELMQFRSILVDVLDEYEASGDAAPGESPAAGRKRVFDVLDRSVKASVARYTDDAERERDVLQRQLEATNEQKDRFIAMLSHELRSPIAPIINAAWLLKRPDLPDAKRKEARDIIERQARHQARLIDDLLDVNRVARGKIELRRQIVDFRDAIGHALESLRPATDGKSLQVSVDLPAHAVPVHGDPTRLAQIALNVLSNAVKFTPPSGTIAVSLREEGAEAVLRVQDTGIGISEAMLPRVFDMFAQADTSCGRGPGGLGVGLTLARHLVEMHGGRITAHSHGVGAGAEFVVRLPRVDAEGLAPEVAVGVPAPKRRVIVVEDNPDARETLASVLALVGVSVLTAGNGEEALRLAAEDPADAYVIDVGLPGMSGYDLARHLRRLPARRPPLLIALTGFGTPEDKDRARAAGFDRHVTKPADLDELQRLLVE